MVQVQRDPLRFCKLSGGQITKSFGFRHVGFRGGEAQGMVYGSRFRVSTLGPYTLKTLNPKPYSSPAPSILGAVFSEPYMPCSQPIQSRARIFVKMELRGSLQNSNLGSVVLSLSDRKLADYFIA